MSLINIPQLALTSHARSNIHIDEFFVRLKNLKQISFKKNVMGYKN